MLGLSRFLCMTMLDRMRRHKGWLKWSLALVVLAFIVFYIPSFLAPPTTFTVGAAPNEVIAEVEGRTLTAGEFLQRYNAQMQAYRTAYGGSLNDQMLRQLGVDQQILRQMVDELAAMAEAERHGIVVSDDELAQRIFAMPALQENGRFIGEQRYELLLRSQVPPLTKASFEDGLRRSLMIEKLSAALTDWMTESDAEVDREFTTRNEKVKLQVVALTADQFRDQVTVTDADVASYFDSRQETYRVGERRKVKVLVVDRDQALATIVVPAADVQRYYNDNIAQYQTPEQVRASHILLTTAGKDEAEVQKRAEEVLRQVKSGGDFAALATKFSEDEGSKVNGGDLDYFARGRMVPEFEQSAFSLAVGQTSELVKSQFGFHIIRVTDKRAAITQTLDEARVQIEDQLKRQRADQQVAARANELAARIDDPSDLDTLGKEPGLALSETEFFGRDDPIPGLGVAPLVAAAAFQLADGGVSRASIMSPRGPVFIALTGKNAPYVPKLDEVRDRVREDLIRSRAAELSRQRAASIAAALRSAPNFPAAAKSQGLEAAETELITRRSPITNIGVSTQVDEVAFKLPVGGVSDPIATDTATVIVKVLERDEVTPDELRLGRETMRSQLVGERRDRFFASYLEKAKERMSIDIRQDVITRMMAATL
jgi:peptidyl-prolyl cis-trans isomerase D